MSTPSPSWHLYVPKLITVLRQGYGRTDLRQDVIAGLTVAIVALPLAMALGIASGSTPEKGLVTAVIAGFLISALGGSRFQIGGPTGRPSTFTIAFLAGVESLLSAVVGDIDRTASSSHKASRTSSRRCSAVCLQPARLLAPQRTCSRQCCSCIGWPKRSRFKAAAR